MTVSGMNRRTAHSHKVRSIDAGTWREGLTGLIGLLSSLDELELTMARIAKDPLPGPRGARRDAVSMASGTSLSESAVALAALHSRQA